MYLYRNDLNIVKKRYFCHGFLLGLPLWQFISGRGILVTETTLIIKKICHFKSWKSQGVDILLRERK